MFFEGSIEAFSKTGVVDPNHIYTPHLISDRIFVFRNETAGAMADAELAFVRLDEQSTHYPFGSALRRCLSNLEAIATICVDGVKPDLRTMLLINAQQLAESEGHSPQAARDVIVPDREHDAALAAVRYSSVLQRISLASTPFEFSAQTLIDLHRDLLYEADEHRNVHFRRRPYRVLYDPQDRARTVYFPPEPERIDALIDDLMQFCNQPYLSPVTQAAIAHFHLEAIRPFKTGMDRTGRAFVHCILRSRNLYKHIIPPIALVPAMNIRNHAQLLFPYRGTRNFTDKTAALALDRWVAHCARCTQLSVNSVLVFMNNINRLEAEWSTRVGDIRAGSAIDILLRELPGVPLLTVASAMALTGKGFSATNEAINQLMNLGILKLTSSGQRNRCFEAPAVIEFLTAIERDTIPTELVARESYFRD